MVYFTESGWVYNIDEYTLKDEAETLTEIAAPRALRLITLQQPH